MFVRVEDKGNKRYYKSIVYGIVGCGCDEKYIVYNPFLKAFEYVGYFDKETDELLINKISLNEESWVTYDRVPLLKFKQYCKKKGHSCSIELFRGYEDVVQNHDFLYQLIEENRKIEPSKDTPKIRRLHDEEEWNYINTQNDANEFMKAFVGFHDSTMEKMQYEESFEEHRLTVTFDNSGWYGIVELCFEGLLAMNLRPALENYSNEFYSACLIVEENLNIFWADDDLEKVDMTYEGSYIRALNLKWRKIK